MSRLFIFALFILTLFVPLKGLAQTDGFVTYTSSDGTLNFDYPADWLIDDQYPIGVLLANSPFALQNSVDTLGQGDLQLGVVILPLDELFSDPSQVDSAYSFAELLQSRILGDAANYVVQSAAPIEHHYDAARLDTQTGTRRAINILMMPDEHTIVQLLASIDPRELLIYEDVILQIAASVRYGASDTIMPEKTSVPPSSNAAALPLEKTFRSDDGAFTFRLPNNWFASGSGFVASIMNFNDAWSFGDPLADDQFVMTILVLPLDTYRGELSADPTAEELAYITTEAEVVNVQPIAIGSSAVSFDVNRAGNPNDEFSLVILTGDDQVMQVTASSGNMALYRDTVIAIVETVQYTPQ